MASPTLTNVAAGVVFVTGGGAQSDEPLTAEDELLLKVGARLRQGFPRAALAAAVDLVNEIATKHNLDGGAYL